MNLTKDETTGVLQVSGILDIVAANFLRQARLERFVHQQEVGVDFSGVEACDTSALQVILAGQRNKELRVLSYSSAIADLGAALGIAFDAGDTAGNQLHAI